MDQNQQDNGNSADKARWMEAFQQTQNYRDYLCDLSVKDEEKIISYLLSKEDIDALLQQDANKLDGIRIYIGHKILEEDKALVRLHVVATKKDNLGNYEDYNIPDKNGFHFRKFAGADRPCPSQCGIRKNDLNHPWKKHP